MTLRESVIEHSVEGGLTLMGGSASVEATAIRDTKQTSDGIHGEGVVLQGMAPFATSALLRASTISHSSEAGVLVAGSKLVFEQCSIEDTAASTLDGVFGDGIVVMSSAGPASAALTDTRVAGSARAAISNFGAMITVGDTTIECNAIDLDGETFAGKSFEWRQPLRCEPLGPSCTALSSNLAAPSPIGEAPGPGSKSL